MLTITTDGRKAALDIRLVVDDDPSGPSKVDVAADAIYQVWEQTKDNEYLDSITGDPSPVRGGLQLVFSDIGTPNPTRWNAYDELASQLVARGMPAEAIRFMHEAKTDADKARLFASARAGHAPALFGWSAPTALLRRLAWPLVLTGVLTGLGVVCAFLLSDLSWHDAVWTAGIAAIALAARWMQSMRSRDIPVEFLAPTVIPGSVDMSAVKILVWLGDGVILTVLGVLAAVVLPWGSATAGAPSRCTLPGLRALGMGPYRTADVRPCPATPQLKNNRVARSSGGIHPSGSAVLQSRLACAQGRHLRGEPL